MVDGGCHNEFLKQKNGAYSSPMRDLVESDYERERAYITEFLSFWLG